jgi:hypothetical protein
MSTTTYPLGHRKDKTTRDFVCTLYHKTQGRADGMTPEEVYNEMVKGLFPGPEGTARTQLINQLVAGCEQSGYIEQVPESSPVRIKMTTAGINLCNSVKAYKSYCYADDLSLF